MVLPVCYTLYVGPKAPPSLDGVVRKYKLPVPSAAGNKNLRFKTWGVGDTDNRAVCQTRRGARRTKPGKSTTLPWFARPVRLIDRGGSLRIKPTNGASRDRFAFLQPKVFS